MSEDRGQAYFDFSIVADYYSRYIGEEITFAFRLDAMQDIPDLSLRFSLPKGFLLKDAVMVSAVDTDDHLDQRVPVLEGSLDSDVSHYLWQFDKQIASGSRLEFMVRVELAYAEENHMLGAVATLSGSVLEQPLMQVVNINVKTKADYLRFLPAIYDDDDFMGRFLMLFESFWNPISNQIDHLDYYFDPKMAPPEFLAWLASWFSITFQDDWSEEKRRALIYEAQSLYRKRGTRGALSRFIEIYTGAEPEIVEHRGEDFRLGVAALMGAGLSLGEGGEMPYSFTVSLELSELDAADKQEKERKETARRLAIEKIISNQKPAGMAYALNLKLSRS